MTNDNYAGILDPNRAATPPTATDVWRALLAVLLMRGEETSQGSAGAAFRGRTSHEVRGFITRWPLDRALVLCPERKPGLRFYAAEPAWVLSGDNRLATIAPFAPKLAQLSDDGIFLQGAYGPPYVDQLPYVIGTLLRDPATRQAVAAPWRRSPGRWADVPCTTSLQWFLRNGRLHMSVTMRSSDAWLGVPNDVHTFAMMAAHLGLCLRHVVEHRLDSEDPVPPALVDFYHEPLLGELALCVSGSQHLYLLDREAAERCVARDDELFGGVVAPIDLRDFEGPDHLINHLWAVARREPIAGFRAPYLLETLPC